MHKIFLILVSVNDKPCMKGMRKNIVQCTQMQLYWLYSVFNSKSVLGIFLKSHGVLSILQKRGSICPNYFTFFILRIYQWYSNIPFILNTKNLLFVIKENIPSASTKNVHETAVNWHFKRILSIRVRKPFNSRL